MYAACTYVQYVICSMYSRGLAGVVTGTERGNKACDGLISKGFLPSRSFQSVAGCQARELSIVFC